MKTISTLIKSLSGKSPYMNPTEIYNEGWMTRLLVYYSVQENLRVRDVSFGELSNWTSEGLISSPFVFADKLREGYTHADMVLGDFSVNFENRGQISVNPEANLFGIIEAKMGSSLSKGTKHAPEYNQASRNIACIAFNTLETDIPVFFGVAAPEATLQKHQIKDKLVMSSFISQIENRFNMYEDDHPIQKFREEVYTRSLAVRTFMLSYEEWIDNFQGKQCYEELSDFYKSCLKWNRISS